MSDDINLKEPDWKDVPDHCPRCGQDLEPNLTETPHGLTGLKTGYRDGESDYGEYREVHCHSCDFPLQRHYPESDVTAAEDPLVDPDPWLFRAQILEAETVLKHREAQVQALKEEEQSHSEIADRLGISESTVGEYSRRISNRIDESIRTLEELGDKVDPLRHIEGQLDGWPVVPVSEWKCPACKTDLEAGDDAKLVAEFVSNTWQSLDLFCSDCDPDLTGGEFDEAANYSVTYALVEGTLDRYGDDYVDIEGGWHSRDSLTLREPSVRKIIN